jgi:hypothetical protein
MIILDGIFHPGLNLVSSGGFLQELCLSVRTIEITCHNSPEYLIIKNDMASYLLK